MILVHHVYQIALSIMMKVKKKKVVPFCFLNNPFLTWKFNYDWKCLVVQNPVVSLLFSEIISGSSGGCHFAIWRKFNLLKITMLTFLVKEKKKKQVAFWAVYFWRIHEKVSSQILSSNIKVSVLTKYKALRGTFVQKPLFKGKTLVRLRDEV